MISTFSGAQNLKKLNLTYQVVGILCVIGILWFSLISWLGLLSIVTLTIIVIALLKFRNKVIEIELLTENTKMSVTYYTKKYKMLEYEDISYKTAPGQLTLYVKNKKVVTIEKFSWSDFDLMYDFITKNCKKNNNKNNLKEFALDVIKEEAMDYDSVEANNNIN